MNVGFILVSYARNAPAGMESSTAALLKGLNSIGHRAVVICAGPTHAGDDPESYRLKSLSLSPPVTDRDLLASINEATGLITELDQIAADLKLDIVCWVDCLWGLGFLGWPRSRLRSVLAVHVVGSDSSLLQCALARRPDVVIVPSSHILAETRKLRGRAHNWRVVPNALSDIPRIPASLLERRRLRESGPFRTAARLGPEKGALELISAARNQSRPIEIVLAEAAFEGSLGSQSALKTQCLEAARGKPGVSVHPGLPWTDVAAFLGGASLTIVPSLAESFGLVALESMAVGTPVAAFSVGNLPELIAGAGVIVPIHEGFAGLWRAAEELLADEDSYLKASATAFSRASGYTSPVIAKQWITAVTN
jgi:glycosyltransferase involved in cell wall biosynthesis